MNINIVTEWEKHIFITKNVPRPLVPKAQTVGVPVMGVRIGEQEKWLRTVR